MRAAIMGILLILAAQTGRIYSMRNAIICAGLLMVYANPKVLAFDIGFQLSFLALLGMVYLAPAFKTFFRMNASPENHIFSWKGTALTTLAAQLAVLPLLLQNFGSVSLFSLLANILILEFIPFTMGLGFLVAGVGFLAPWVAQFFAWIALIFLKFETGTILFFGKWNITFTFSFSLFSTILYYACLVWFILAMIKRANTRPRAI